MSRAWRTSSCATTRPTAGRRRRSMWLSNIFFKTLRDFRVAIVGWGIGTGLLVYIVLASFASLVTTPQARASLVTLAHGFSWLAQPIAVDTPGGYATFKYGPVILLMAIWALSTGGRIIRGEEERGSMDVLLSLPEGRTRVALQKLAAVWLALLGMGLLIALLVFAGGRTAHASFTFIDSLLFGLNLAMVAAVPSGRAARADAPGERLVAAFGVLAQPGNDPRGHVLVDAWHRRVCGVDGGRGQTNRVAAGQHLPELTGPQGFPQHAQRHERHLQRCHPECAVCVRARRLDGVYRDPGQSLVGG